MAERQNSNNPIPSNAMADLNDNAISLDEFVNSSATATTDRFGVKYKTVKQIVKEAEAEIVKAQNQGYVKKAGDTMSGSLSMIRKDPYLKLQDTSGNIAEIDVNASNFYIQVSEPDLQSKRTRCRYNINDKTFIFENVNDLTINGKSALKAGDYNIGNTATPLTTFTSLSQLSEMPCGDHKLGMDTSSTLLPVSGYCYVYKFGVRNRDKGGAFLLKEYNTDKVFVGYNLTSTENVTWQELITSANIHNYQSGIGFDQVWQDVTDSRATGVNYTNTTGKPIFVTILSKHDWSAGYVTLYVNDLIVGRYFDADKYANEACLSTVVPPNSTYKVTCAKSGFITWNELR